VKGFLGRWRSVSLVVLFGVSSLALSLSPLLSGTAHASSAQDQAVQVTTTLPSSYYSDLGTCAEKDFKANWSEIFSATSGTMVDGTAFNWTSPYSGAYSSYKSLWDARESWGVTSYWENGPTNWIKYVDVWFTDDPGATVDFAGSGTFQYAYPTVHSGYTGGFIRVLYRNNWFCIVRLCPHTLPNKNFHR